MRGRLLTLSLVLCGALAAHGPAEAGPPNSATRGGGARGFSGMRGVTRGLGGRGASSGWRMPTSASRSAGSMLSRSGAAASPGTWRNASRAAAPRSAWSSAASRANRSAFANPARSASVPAPTSRSSSFLAPRSRGSVNAPSARRAASDELSPFARSLSRSNGFTSRRAGTTPDATSTRSRFAPSARGTADATASRRSPGSLGISRSPGADRRPSAATATGRRGTTADATAVRGGATADRAYAARGRPSESSYRRYGYYGRSYPYYGHHPYHGHYHCSSYYPSSGFYLSFTWGVGAYLGWRYYYPYYHCGSGLSFAFFYGAPITYAYVPYGFYYDTTPVYVTRYVYVQDTYPVTQYEVVEADPPAAAPAEGQEVVEPTPAAGTPVVEKYLREASEAFHKADYLEAAKLFRLAALSAPDNAAPLFALGQALVAIGSDAYAAKVMRKAIVMNPGLVKEPGDIVGVYQTQEEFERVLGELQTRAGESPAGSDARFLLAVEHYFSGDPKAVDELRFAAAANPDDEAVKILLDGAEKRFAAGDELPPLDPAAEPK